MAVEEGDGDGVVVHENRLGGAVEVRGDGQSTVWEDHDGGNSNGHQSQVEGDDGGPVPEEFHAGGNFCENRDDVVVEEEGAGGSNNCNNRYSIDRNSGHCLVVRHFGPV